MSSSICADTWRVPIRVICLYFFFFFFFFLIFLFFFCFSFFVLFLFLCFFFYNSYKIFFTSDIYVTAGHGLAGSANPKNIFVIAPCGEMASFPIGTTPFLLKIYSARGSSVREIPPHAR